MFNINPNGTINYNGLKVPTILCHWDSYNLGLGSSHYDVYNWFNKYNKTMQDVRNDVKNILEDDDMTQELLEYDEVVSKYNRTRSGTTSENDWGGHIVDYYRAALSYRIKDYLISQGFGFVK